MQVSPKDYKYLIDRPDKSFSPERNRAIIAETMRETDQYFKSLGYRAMKGMENSIDIMAAYGRHLFAKSGTKSIENYLGPELTKTIIGERLRKKIQTLQAADKLSKLARPNSDAIIT